MSTSTFPSPPGRPAATGAAGRPGGTVLITQSPSLPDASLARRFEAIDGTPRYLSVADHDGDTNDATASAGEARYVGEEIFDTGRAQAGPGALSVVAFGVPDADTSQFEDWYQGEHVELLMRVPGWLRIRRYRVRVDGSHGEGWTHLAFHELADVEVMDRPERAAARATARRDALANRPWFAQSGRWLYRPLPGAAVPGAPVPSTPAH